MPALFLPLTEYVAQGKGTRRVHRPSRRPAEAELSKRGMYFGCEMRCIGAEVSVPGSPRALPKLDRKSGVLRFASGTAQFRPLKVPNLWTSVCRKSNVRRARRSQWMSVFVFHWLLSRAGACGTTNH